MRKELNRIKYNYIDPSGNITIIVESEITATQQSEVLQCSCLENPMYGGAWWAAVYGVA